ncbi:MAG: carotenoid oxygenase family protein [Actinobacteria bacterium]|nr:carotenoid oxygenase family protein [Actinomycetota bacterium]
MATGIQDVRAETGSHSIGFRSVAREFREPVGLPVEGRIPAWLTGSVVRSGPASFEPGGRSLRHWFDGLALLDRFAVQEGRVTYASRMLESDAYRAASEKGEISYQEFATDPCRSLFKRFVSAFSPRPTDNANVNVAPDGHNWVAMTETPLQAEFDPRTLETVGVREYDDGLKVHHASAHPHHDTGRRELLSYAIAYGPRSCYQLFRLPDGGRRRERYAQASVREPCYMHSFALTERYAVLTDQPFTVNPLGLLLSGRPFIENFRWHGDRATRFMVFDRAGGRHVGTDETEPFFTFHHVNAFERRGEVVLDICAYDDAGIIDALYLERLRAGERPPTARVRRYRLDLPARTVRQEVEFEPAFELPRIDYRRRNGRDYRFVWGASNRSPESDWFDQIAKLDTTTGDVVAWYEEGCHPGEPVLVREPGTDAGAEDAGVILSVVLDARRAGSFLVVLDARTMEELARAEAPVRLPPGFHAQFGRDLV